MPDQEDFPVPVQPRLGLDVRLQVITAGPGRDLRDPAHRVLLGIDVVEARGQQGVAGLEIVVARDELQGQPSPVPVRQVAVVGPRVADQQGVADVGDQQDGGLEQAGAGDLADDAVLVQHRLPHVGAVAGAAVDADGLAERAGVDLRDFRDQHPLRMRRDVQLRQGPQATVLRFQRPGGVRPGDVFQQLLPERPVLLDQFLDAAVVGVDPLEELLGQARGRDDRLHDQAHQGGRTVDHGVAVVDADQHDGHHQAADQFAPEHANRITGPGRAVERGGGGSGSPREGVRVLLELDVLL